MPLNADFSVERLPSHRNKQPILSVRLDQSSDQPVLRLNEASVGERRRELAVLNPDVDAMRDFWPFLTATHSFDGLNYLVSLFGRPGSRANHAHPANRRDHSSPRQPTHSSPLGLIDGGISEALSDWVIDRWDILADEDVDLAHGTFIGGLAAVGGALNGAEICRNPTARS